MTEQTNRKRTRREVITGATAALAAASAGPLIRPARGAEPRSADAASEPFKYCLNTSTISGQNIGIAAEIDLAAKVGFHAIEPWIRELEAYVKKNGSLKDLGKQLDDSGLKVADAIGFAQWIVDDQAKRNAALEQAKREMDMVAQIGGTHIAAPPAGAISEMPLPVVAERYAALIEAGKQAGVTPVLELWGHAKVLSRIGEVAYVACESRQPNSAILLDIYHIYKGGSDFSDLHILSGRALPLIHTNDYPDKPDRAKINDSFRVYPGDGVAPLKEIFRTLRSIGFDGYLSVELFNRTYWKQSPLKVAQASIDKTRAAVRNAFID